MRAFYVLKGNPERMLKLELPPQLMCGRMKTHCAIDRCMGRILVGRSTSQETCHTYSFISSGLENVKRSVKVCIHLRSLSRSAHVGGAGFFTEEMEQKQVLTTPYYDHRR